LSALSQAESETLVQFLANKLERQQNVLQLSAGNPLFIETLLNASSLDSVPEPIAEAAASMLATLTKATYEVLQILAVFRNAVPVVVLGTMYQKAPDIEARLETASRLGLIKRLGDRVEIRFPIIRDKLYASLSKGMRRRLNRRAFDALSNRDVEAE